jgi:hypothetical protein
MNIKYVPQKSEKFSFTGLLLGCVASILIFLLLSWFLNSDLRYRWQLDEDGEYSNFGVVFTSIIIYFVTGLGIWGADNGIFILFHRYCNNKFIKAYISLTILLGFYTKWVYTSFLIHKNLDKSAQLLNFIIDPIFVIKETFTDLSFLDFFLSSILLFSVVCAKLIAITNFKENDVYCNNCNRWPEKIEFRLYSKDFDWISKKFKDDINCLLSLPAIDVSSIEEKDHSDRKIDPPIESITNSKHINVKINHCSTCNSLNTISIYSITYSDSKYRYSMSSNKVSDTYILTKNQFEAFELKKNETKTDFCEILEKSMNS